MHNPTQGPMFENAEPLPSATKNARRTPFPTRVPPTVNKANRNDGPYLALGTNVMGPFLRNLAIPKEPDNTLKMNVPRKKESPNLG